MNTAALLELVFRFGHFYSPHALSHGLVAEKDLAKLTPADPVAKAAIRSYQRLFQADLDRLSLRAPEFGGHNRAASADGDPGPATVDLLNLPRCGVPDFRHPEQAILEGNWPDECRREITTSYQMELSGVTPADLAALWVEADRNWESALDVGFRFVPESYPNTRFHAHKEAMRGGILAWHQLATNNCNARLPGAYNSTVTWNSALLVTTITHEHGHGLGFDHVSNAQATMYPSITQASMGRRGAPHAADLAEAVRQGYRERTTPVPGPDHPEPSEHRLYLASQSPIRIIPQ